MAIVIALYDQMLFRPIVTWADRFRAEQVASQQKPRSWVYELVRRTRLLKIVTAPFAWSWQQVMLIRLGRGVAQNTLSTEVISRSSRLFDHAWLACIVGLAGLGAVLVIHYLGATLGVNDLVTALASGLATLSRVTVLIAIASLVWVPAGVWIGLRPRVAEQIQPLAQFLAAFPANVLFPIVVVAIVANGANPNIWLSPLMVLGTQWYILFNVIAGASAIPTDLREVAAVYQIRSWTWWRYVALPAVFPYYVTGAITASGGSWNASIVAEVASWGDVKLEAFGLGAYIAAATAADDFPRVVLGIAVMALFVTFFNRAFWRPLYSLAERRLRLN
jgi:NitT/TauT family transport system permease protein